LAQSWRGVDLVEVGEWPTLPAVADRTAWYGRMKPWQRLDLHECQHVGLRGGQPQVS